MAPVHSTFVAKEVRAPKVSFTPVGTPQGKGPPPPSPRSQSPPPRYDPRTSGSTPHRFSFTGKCNYCGQMGHKEARCPEKQALSSERMAKVAMATEEEAPYNSTFSKMYDTDEDPHSCAVTYITSSIRTGHHALTRPTEAKFDTGATGSVITNSAILSDVSFVTPTIFKGLVGDLEVRQMGTLGGIGRVYYNPHAGMSIISASECATNGLNWTYRDDAFHQQTSSKTYIFHLKSGLYIRDITDYPPIQPTYLRLAYGFVTSKQRDFSQHLLARSAIM